MNVKEARALADSHDNYQSTYKKCKDLILHYANNGEYSVVIESDFATGLLRKRLADMLRTEGYETNISVDKSRLFISWS